MIMKTIFYSVLKTVIANKTSLYQKFQNSDHGIIELLIVYTKVSHSCSWMRHKLIMVRTKKRRNITRYKIQRQRRGDEREGHYLRTS